MAECQRCSGKIERREGPGRPILYCENCREDKRRAAQTRHNDKRRPDSKAKMFRRF